MISNKATQITYSYEIQKVPEKILKVKRHDPYNVVYPKMLLYAYWAGKGEEFTEHRTIMTLHVAFRKESLNLRLEIKVILPGIGAWHQGDRKNKPDKIRVRA